MALQRRARLDESDGSTTDAAAMPGKETQVQRIAAQGVAGGGGAMPFADQIASSFGPEHANTVQRIEAHTGSAATAASEDIGAKAYATGNAVAFAGTPDLHTAAHEAAHVVQQRQGVHLKGGVGQEGDPYERHADAVADRVVQGRSAADLLGAASVGNGTMAVQRKGDAKPPKHDPKKDAADFESDGPNVVYALAGVFRDSYGADMRGYMPARYHDALAKLMQVKTGHLDGRQRRALLDEVTPIFEPYVRANDHFSGADDYLPEHWAQLRKDVLFTEARSRVQGSIVIDDGKHKEAIEIPDDSHPREQAEVLGQTLPKLVESMKTTIERAKTLGEATGVNAEMLERLETAIHMLELGGGFLKLNDAEFQKEVGHIKGVMHGVSTYSELVKTVLEIGSGSIALTCKASALLMKAVGDHAMMEACEHTGAAVSAALGKVVAAVEIVHGLSVMFDKNASRDDRIGGGVEVAAGIASLAAGTSLAAMPIMGPYALIKAAQYLYSGAVIGWETYNIREEFEWMQGQARGIASGMSAVGTAGLLAAQEKDGERRGALVQQEKMLTAGLKDSLAGFLDRCGGAATGLDRGDTTAPMNHYPGNITILRERFMADVDRIKEVKTEEEVIQLAHDVMRDILWCFEHGAAIVKGSATNKHADQVEGIQAELDKQNKKKEE